MKYIFLLFVMLVFGFTAQAQNQSITVSGFAYTPNNVTVNVGDTVFFNFPNGTHPISISGVDTFRAAIASGRDTAYYFVAHRPGSFSFVCTIHPNMTGTININMPQASSAGNCSDIFISEYAEGSSNNKYIELYNASNGDIDLSNYFFYLLPNGGVQNTSGSYSKISRYFINRTIPSHKTVVLFNGGLNATALAAVAAAGDTVRTGLTAYNGDDAILILNPNRQIVDMLGNYGEDLPGTSGSWAVTGANGTTGSTQNFTLVRIPTVFRGNASWAAQANEWNVLASDDFTNANLHTIADCALGLNNVESNTIGLKLFPNPVDHVLNITSKEIIRNIEIYNSIGKLIVQKNVNDYNEVISTATFTKGMYLAKIYTAKGVSVEQIIK